jgi:hypothetical protein
MSPAGGIRGRREARQPWRFEFLLDRLSTHEEWVYTTDARVRLPWDRDWLADTLELLGHDAWARLTRLTRLTRHTATADLDAGAAGVSDQDWR